MAADNTALIMVATGLCIFIFLAFLIGYGQMVGGNWQTIAQGVTAFIVVIVVFTFAAFVIVKVAGRR